MDAIETALQGADVDLAHEALPELAGLRDCPQTAAFHGEGDAAAHSRWVYDLAREHTENLCLDDAPHLPLQRSAVRLAGLLHDVGKPGTTRGSGPGRWSAPGHDLEGAHLVAGLFATHPALRVLPLGVHASVHAMVRAHMWTYAGERIDAGAALRISHVTDPRLLSALWDSDARGRICDDPAQVADRVGFATLVLADLDADRPDSHGLLDQVADAGSADPRAWRETFRALVLGELDGVGAVAARLAAAERHTTGGSVTYLIGLPGVGKSTWVREVWAPATGGLVLSSEGVRRRDRRAAAAAVLKQIPEALAAGRSVCVDATHLRRETRDVLVTYAGRYGAPLHAVHFPAPLSLALRRQAIRPAADAVPAASIRRMAQTLRWPTPDEYQTLTVVEQDGRGWAYGRASRWLSDAVGRPEYQVRGTPWTG